MPIYEYQCDECNTTFERLILRAQSGTSPDCPQCNSANTFERLSTFSTQTGGAVTSVPSTPPALS